MKELGAGRLAKMRVAHECPVEYQLELEGELIDMNALLGQRLRIEHKALIRCCHCSRVTKKSFNQGYCYPCFKKLAQCDRCIMSPELCHYAQGTCREPEWGESHCMREHVVYLANSSGLKVGITRDTQVPTRWIDQGAIQAVPLMRVSSRRLSGLVEDALKEWLPDKTNWRRMLKHEVEPIDLLAERDRVMELAEELVYEIAAEHPEESMEWCEDEVWEFEYPSLAWPSKASTYNFDKTPLIEDRLMAIKGQYLIFEKACLNIRKFTSYDVTVSLLEG